MDFTPESLNATLKGANTLIDCAGKVANLFATLKGALSKSDSSADADVEAALADLGTEIRQSQIAGEILEAKLILVKRELAAAEQMDAKLARYELYQTPTDNWVYAPKNPISGPKKRYFVCPTCMHNREYSILQGGRFVKKCDKCNSTFTFEPRSPISYRNSKPRFR